MRAPHDGLVRVRFAPSPTGYLHIGGLRTALYCYLFARSRGGQLVLRIEDTDRSRFLSDAEEDVVASLAWAGLSVDESPVKAGPFAPYRQSERTNQYLRHTVRLLHRGHAYYAFDTPEELDAMRKDGTFTYNAAGRMHMTNEFTLGSKELGRRLTSGEPYVVRLKTPEDRMVRFHDIIRGEVSVEASTLDDQVLLKSDGMPTYHLANVVDDHLMNITHVIRGEEWLPSTPKHILLYEAFGWEPPNMAHLPLIMSPTGGKLSKRNAEKQGIPVLVRAYRDLGFEPEAVINFLALLGWNPGTEEEVFGLADLVDAFTLDRVGASGAQFSLDKLRWFNQQHLRRLAAEDLLARVRSSIHAHGITVSDAYLMRVLDLLRERIVLAGSVATEYGYFFAGPSAYDEKGVRKRWKDDSAGLLTAYADRLELLDPFDEEALESALRTLAGEQEVGAGRIIHPVRLATSGSTFGPSLFGMLAVLGRDVCVRRLQRAVQVLGR